MLNPAQHLIKTIKDATRLRAGERILLPGGRVEIVTKPSTRAHGGVVIHTDRRDVLTGLPCPVKVLYPLA